MSRLPGSPLGQMRHRVVLEAPLETPDGAGGVTRLWQQVSTLWAAIEPIEGQSILVGDAPGITATHRITIRWRADVTGGHRLTKQGRIFAILSVADPEENRESLGSHSRRKKSLTMTDAASALRQAFYACLIADSAVTALLGGPKIYDEVPRGELGSYAVIGEGSIKDWSTSLDRGHEHLVAVTVWSKEGGARQANQISDAIRTALEAMPPALDGHHLVNLVTLATDLKREANAKLVRAILRLRAVTEVM